MSGLMDFCYCSRNQHFFNHHLSESESLLRNLRISPVIPIDGLGVVIDENNHQQHQHHLDPEVELTLLTAETMLARCLSETVLQQREIQGDFHLRKSFSLYIQVLRSDISLSSLFSKDPYTNCTHDFPVRDRRCRIIEGLFFGFGTMNALSMLYPEQLGPILKQLFKDTAGSTYHLYEQEGKLLRIVACGNGYRGKFGCEIYQLYSLILPLISSIFCSCFAAFCKRHLQSHHLYCILYSQQQHFNCKSLYPSCSPLHHHQC